jgi:aspartyl-tRNA(Asn)/glutamyl-tRNA(Gln) amidotransferase subunit A
MSNLWSWSAHRLHDAFVQGAISAESIIVSHLERIEAIDATVKAFLFVDAEGALREARRQDSWSREERRVRPLSGVPLAVKDNVVTRAMPTSAGSKILEGFLSPYDATVIDKVCAAGAIVIGKTNLDEFAMGSSTEHSAFHSTANPWDVERVPGGSSGGSAAAVAARMAPLALGSDTGGSIRQPAAYCGVVGMKPTYGRVSRYGLIAFASSLDQIGPFARTIEDSRLLYEVISGHDPKDATSLGRVPEEPKMATDGRWRIGLPREYFGDGIEPGVRALVEAALDKLRDLGHELVEISLPHTPYAIATYYLIAPAEASSNLSRYDGVRYGLRVTGRDLISQYETTRDLGFGAEVKRRILLGTHALSAGYYDAYYLTAQKVRTLIRQDFDEAFRTVDFIVTPTTPDLAFRLGERSDDPLKMYLGDIFTATANLAGIPGLSMPVGLAEGLPVGLQWLAPPLYDGPLFDAARRLEQVLDTMPWPLEVTP